jgi:hypothetical protein
VTVVGEIVEGALATLKRLDEKRINDIHKSFQEPRLYYTVGLRKAPQLKDVRSDLIDEMLWIWEIFPEGKEKAVGYAGIVTYSGPPFVFIYFFDGKDDLELARDVLVQLAQGFFKESEEEQLWFYLMRPVKPEIQEMLVEGGFDPYEDETLPGVDLKKEAAFRMERHTWAAYYNEASGGNYEAGEEDDDDPRELEF